jgi:predicted O-linked N-acetylglucosamine transferase (SPINDLY family)
LPGDETGHVTFGSFNNLAKINDVVLDAWARIIEGVPGSVLLLKAMGIRDERVRERIGQAFRARGLDIEGRITMLAQERAGVDHIRLYNRIDVALDTFPYNGTTTTFEALWMGTPVVALTGAAHAGRVGASLMARIGLDSLVCPTIDAYIATAIALGNDRERIRTLRRGLRERLLASPLMDAKRLARQMETAFAQSWRDYCEGVR